MKLKPESSKDFWIYDIETFPNIFTLAIANAVTSEARIFEISDRKDDSKLMRKFLTRLYKNQDYMVGYNNIGFDYPVVHHFMRNQSLSCSDLYDKAMDIINSMRNSDNRFQHTIPAHKMFIKQIDLFKIHHFDNVAKSTSLKMLEFNMRMNNIEDLPFPVGTHLDDDQKDVLIEYNKHDIKATHEFYLHSLKAIEFRFELSNKFGKDFTNHNDTKIGKDYFITKLEEEMPESCYIKLPNGQRKINQTKRDSIDLGDVIYPYVKFDRPEFNAVLSWIKSRTITETKGVFSDLTEHVLGSDLSNYTSMSKKSKKLSSVELDDDGNVTSDFIDRLRKTWANSLMEVETRELKSKKGAKSYYRTWNESSNLNCVIDGFRFDFGTGGIHGSVESQIVESDDQYMILDVDV